MGLPSHCFFKQFKIPFWKKPTTADHYKDLNPGEWYCWAPRPAHKQPAAKEDEPLPAAKDTGDAAYTEAACGDDACALFVLD
jgi:hypothetical protein